jgi:hypothetical protein
MVQSPRTTALDALDRSFEEEGGIMGNAIRLQFESAAVIADPRKDTRSRAGDRLDWRSLKIQRSRARRDALTAGGRLV